jgi:hypothetical protein
VKRGAALIALTLLLAACGSSAAKRPAIYAQVQQLGRPAGPTSVWRDEKGRITFEYGAIQRYDPSTHVLTEFNSGKVRWSRRYPSDRAAWAAIDIGWGTTKRRVMAALASGSPSAEPTDYAVRGVK